MRVYILKLVTGEQIIGKCEDDISNDDTLINIEEPFTIDTVYDAHDEYSTRTYLAPFMFYSETNLFTIQAKHVILYTLPSMEMHEYYFDSLEKLKSKTGSSKAPQKRLN